jgi:bifunctional UDP-N-acetylglucosamine pyrophosphorylase/glucosamine-1-phosphate N-acetyltransferase
MENLASVILAAGRGTRMKSNLPKVLFKLNSKTLVEYCVETVEGLEVERIIAVVGHKREMVKKILGDRVTYAVQEPQLGTGHAVMQTERNLRDFDGDVLVSNGDMPFLTERMFLDLHSACRKENASAVLLTVKTDEYPEWGRIVRSKDGNVKKIVEAKDASDDILKIKEKNTVVYCFKSKDLFNALRKVKSKNAQEEYYLTDVIEIMNELGLKVVSVKTRDYDNIVGINTREELKRAKEILKKKRYESHKS